jgi:hypothetical protein
MAGDWMKIELELPDKPEVHAIAGILNLDPDSVVGKLIRVWQWFDKHTVDGNVKNVTCALLDRIANITGFADAMKKAGWLIVSDDQITIPNFEKHNGKTAKDRAETAIRVAKHRQIKAASTGDGGNGNPVTKPLPEKRREEKNKNQILLSSPPENPALKTTSIPYEKIVSLYHQHLPMCPTVRALTPTRKSYIAARWKSGAMPDLETWEKFFRFVGESKFLTGMVEPQAGKTRFLADLEWLTKETNFVKIVERKYHHGKN